MNSFQIKKFIQMNYRKTKFIEIQPTHVNRRLARYISLRVRAPITGHPYEFWLIFLVGKKM